MRLCHQKTWVGPTTAERGRAPLLPAAVSAVRSTAGKTTMPASFAAVRGAAGKALRSANRIAAPIAALLLLLIPMRAEAARQRPMASFRPMCDSIRTYYKERHSTVTDLSLYVYATSIKQGGLTLFFSKALAEYPLRDGERSDILAIIKATLPQSLQSYRNKLSIRIADRDWKDYASRFYGQKGVQSGGRTDASPTLRCPPLVRRLSSPDSATMGLQGRHIALWHSHGLYYETSLSRWEWQRCRVFGTVEDRFTQSFVLPFLVPMLENAGAVVMLPRERDTNPAEIIVDGDTPESGYFEEGAWNDTHKGGFAHFKEFYRDGENPFRSGKARMAGCTPDDTPTATAFWRPEIEKGGEYAVYVSWQSLPNSSQNAIYEVFHSGGKSRFAVNQRMGGGTWIYLGTFHFRSAEGAFQGVALYNSGQQEGNVVTADAVKFGGGMGNIARADSLSLDSPVVSGHPRWNEGARYWLQWAGFADTVYSESGFRNDYTDDFRSRGIWVNALYGGSRSNPSAEGLAIPIDLAFAFHSDAGKSTADSLIGTLAIYTTSANGRRSYAAGGSRSTAREYADIVQSQIVGDIRAAFDQEWVRRGLRDKNYAESSRPEVPSMILELLSHQNFADIRFGLDPTFRFVVSRAVYKGMLRYLSWANGTPYQVQPLPVRGFSASIGSDGEGRQGALLKWEPTQDPTEPGAVPDNYILYVRRDDGGFDNGTSMGGATSYFFEMEPGVRYGFRIAACNAGGASLPSETLSAGIPEGWNGTSKAMIVNNFTRLSPPLSFVSADSTRSGFLHQRESGVGYIADLHYCGPQYEFRQAEPWVDDDAPGHGASHATWEHIATAGNTFDYPALHGRALMEKGLAYGSCSRESACSDTTLLAGCTLADIICGKQLTTPAVGRKGAPRYSVFPQELVAALERHAESGGAILVSGAYIGSDFSDPIFPVVADPRDMTVARNFAASILHYKWLSANAATTGAVNTVFSPAAIPPMGKYIFAQNPGGERFCTESADAISPVGEGACTIMRYSENNLPAAVAYSGKWRAATLGFPIESLTTKGQIDRLLADLLNFLVR